MDLGRNREALEKKFHHLREFLQSLESVVIAYSGGVDSSFLASVAFESLGKKALAVTAESPLFPGREIEEAQKLAREIGILHESFPLEGLKIPEISQNLPERCYYCKKALFKKLWSLAHAKKLNHVVDGANYEDKDDYRPGMQAAAEMKVHSPLKKTGLTKIEIRKLSKQRGLRTWDKPSMACLASRFPYKVTLTLDKLSQVEKAEQFLQKKGLKQLRVRHHGKTARIEVSPQEMHFFFQKDCREEIVQTLKKLGFIYVTLDLRGYQSGTMNEML
ncbi:ATP-dependent sacrificial sulfur transferase LarE [bacterium]|nr:ATP-dependent sacrificial sulfur transferase LarE [bacterium]